MYVSETRFVALEAETVSIYVSKTAPTGLIALSSITIEDESLVMIATKGKLGAHFVDDKIRTDITLPRDVVIVKSFGCPWIFRRSRCIFLFLARPYIMSLFPIRPQMFLWSLLAKNTYKQPEGSCAHQMCVEITKDSGVKV